MQKTIYVDNLLSGTNSESEAISYYRSAVATLQEGGFNLRSWSSNNSNHRALSTHDNKHDDNISIKVLGMMWHTDSDTLTLRPAQLPHLDIHTKHSVVRITSSFFDPLSIVSPVLIKANIFIQKLWQANLQWDTPLIGDLLLE